MDAVNEFNMELFSMIDVKPPVSRAKMMSVTKSAIKAIKLYKHVVQIVEKFIKKCKPELKVSGLYVVDSIIRQSRHQFGVEKDVFGPRFLKNFTDTFQNICHCPEDDKNKIVRVLNLWQKNLVFGLDIIQPLMDMANGVVVRPPALEAPVGHQPETTPPVKPESTPPVSTASFGPAVPQVPMSDALAAVAQLLQSAQCQELQMMLQNLQQADKTLGATTSAGNIQNLPQMPELQLNSHGVEAVKKSSLAEKLLDRFDCDDELVEMPVSDVNIQSRGLPENVLKQFHGQLLNSDIQLDLMGQTVDMKHSGGMSRGDRHLTPDGYNDINDPCTQSQEYSRENSSVRQEGRRSYGRRSRSGSRSPRRRRSRSSSLSRRSRHRRSPSREQRRRSRSRSRDRIESDKDKERRQKGFPIIKSQTLSVCTTTIWVGQLDKKTQRSDVMALLEEFGQIESINMIPPRGCAYIVMVHRQDAYTALKKLSKVSAYKVSQKPVKIAWALNKGIKPAHKKFWDVEQGVTYIPWSKVKVEELEGYQEGGMLDPETLNPEWTNFKELNNQAVVNGALEMVPDLTHSAHIQMPTVQQAEPIGSPPPFHSPIMLSPTSIPPVGAPFMPVDFAAATLAVARNINAPEDSIENSTGGYNPCSALNTSNQLGSPAAQVMPNPAVMHRPPRPCMPPLQPPPGMPNPHMRPFPSPQNMQHMPPQMIQRGGPMFPPDRFRMPMPFPPRGPPFQRFPPPRPEIMEDGERGHFRTEGPGLRFPRFKRGGW